MKEKALDTTPQQDSDGLLAQMPCYVFSFSEQQPVSEINLYALKSLGYTTDELIGKKKFEQLLTAGCKILFQTHFLPLLKFKGIVEEVILSLKTKKGLEVSLLFNISVEEIDGRKIFHAAGLPMAKRNEYEKGLLETIKNSEKKFSENNALTDLRKNLESNQLILEKKLRETNRLNDEHNQLNKVLAHDLHEPLRKILFYTDALSTDDEKTKQNRSKILDAALSMRTITDSLQRFYSLDYKFDTADRTDLLEVIEEVRKESSAATIECDLKKLKATQFAGRPHHLKALFKELFDNAIKFRQTEKPLEITIASQSLQQNVYKQTDDKYKYQNFIRINFSDNGIGFSNNHAPKVFQLFQKLRPNEGLGIGLSYCKKIVELYNGTITVTSKPNKGTTFTIVLPNAIS
ncbi:sensor histidine kinase [Maribacter sp. 2307UL18-2]|uniref:sensor histidine kinase n=1 Tax=Maribacter sp. 2307UL18-2 TaxID=3386274 RepID=UPI0039BD351F